MRRLQIYMTESEFGTTRDSTTHIYRGLQDHKEDIETRLSFEPDPELARGADIIMNRFEIPLNIPFLEALMEIEQEGTRLFLSSPRAKLYESSKRNLKYFLDTDILPPTIISSDPSELAGFARSLEGKLVSKPIDLNGGKGIVMFSPGKMSDEDLITYMQEKTSGGREEIVLQRYIDGVKTIGDKRINVVMGVPVSYATRLPNGDTFICNECAGGIVVPCELTDDDWHVIRTMQPILDEKGITWAGLDVIGPYLSELNVSSPGLIVEADRVNGNTEGRDRLIEVLKTCRIPGRD